MTRAIGVPVVTWCPLASSTNTPERIFTASGSRRWVVKRDWPGRRRSSSRWMSSAVSGMRGGQPSTTQPIAGPWLSPKLVKRNMWPKVLNDMRDVLGVVQVGVKHTRRLTASVRPVDWRTRDGFVGQRRFSRTLRHMEEFHFLVTTPNFSTIETAELA